MSRKHLAAFFLGSGAVLLPNFAHADPNFEHVFDNVAIEFRGFSGAARFGNGFVNGGDARFVIQGSHAGVVLGGRFGAAGASDYIGPAKHPTTAQFAVFDFGGRLFVDPRAKNSLFVGLGGVYGANYVDRFAFRYADLYGIYSELGIELPRTSPARLTAALRVDFGYNSRAAFSRVPADGPVAMVTANVGFLLGGEDTGNATERAPDPEPTPDATAPREPAPEPPQPPSEPQPAPPKEPPRMISL